MESFFARYKSPAVLNAGPAQHYSYSAGLTLIELLVVLAIIGIIAAVVLISQNSFTNSFTLTNTAYDIALTLRSTQTFGLSSRASGTSRNTGYGLRFDAATPGTFALFADSYPLPDAPDFCHGALSIDIYAPDAKPGNCTYDAGTGKDVIVANYGLNNGIIIKDFCAYDSDRNGWFCKSTSGADALSSLDIVFVRPNPDAFISMNGSYSTLTTKACITVSSPQGASRYIVVDASGQIIANATQCP